MHHVKATGLRRLVGALSFSLAGFGAAWSGQPAFRLECVSAVLLAPAAFWLGETSGERALLIASLVLVLVVELLNSALETAVDRIGLDHHPLSGRAKDQASAAVLMSLVLAAIVWCLIGWERLGGIFS